MSYPAISLTTATAGRHRRPQKRLQTPANLPSTRIRARSIALVTPSPPFHCPHAVHPCPSVDSGLGEPKILTDRRSISLTQKTLEHSEIKGEQCLYEVGCPNPPIAAHAVSDNWMRVIDDSDVYLFRPSSKPLGPPENPPVIPNRVSIDRATTAGFICGEHDKLFEKADLRTGDLESRERLNLLFCRALLKSLNRGIVAEEVGRTHVGAIIESIAPSMRSFVQKQNTVLKYASSLLRTSLTYPVLNWRIRHLTKFLPGNPRIACSGAGDWVDYWIDFWNGPATSIEAIGAWGITIIPKEDGHLATLHYCTATEDRRIAGQHLVKMEKEMQVFSELQGIALEEALSIYAIALTEDLCMGTKPWESYTPKRQNLIKEAWASTDWIPNGSFAEFVAQSVSNGRLKNLNLFR